LYGVCFFAKIFISIVSKYYRKEEGFMNLSRFAKKLMVLIVSVFMFLGSLSINSYQVNAEETPEGTVRVTDGITWEKVDNSTIKGLEPKNVTEEDLSDAGLIKDGSVRVSILVDGDSTIDAGYSAQGIATNASAKAYRAKLLANQQSLAAKISKEVLNGQALDVVWNITLAGNIISANVPYAKIERIKRVAGVKDVVIENQYSAADPVVSDDPNMAVATDMTGTGTTLVLSDYTGAGQAVAIIDTGLDTDHRSFDPEAFDYAIASLDEEVDLIDKRDVAAVFDELNASQRLSSAKAADVYLSTKVPFAFNYVDSDLDVTHDNDGQGEHGSHVAGIAAANRFVKNEDGEFVAAIWFSAQLPPTCPSAPPTQAIHSTQLMLKSSTSSQRMTQSSLCPPATTITGRKQQAQAIRMRKTPTTRQAVPPVPSQTPSQSLPSTMTVSSEHRS